jgi:23S rRNA (cytosine1962-C5)-methyltransferase
MPAPRRPVSHAPDSLRWIEATALARFAAQGTDAHRLASQRGTWIERLGADVLIHHQHAAELPALQAVLTQWGAEHGFVPARVWGRLRPRQNDERAAPVLLAGDAALPATTIVTEEGVRYGLDFTAGYAAGLFLDQRANRRRLRALAPRRVLNTFAYTCSFSVVAALAGAETVSIDLSKKSLDRGRANFRLNGLDPAAHRFQAEDVLGALPRLAARGERFDAIILDPPTFSRGESGRKWQVERGLESLVSAALELAAPGAHLLVSTNCTRLTARDLEQTVRYALKLARRTATLDAESPLPDIPAAEAAKTLWVTLR